MISKEVIFISDFFINEVMGGAEFCNDALMKLLSPDVKIASLKSDRATVQLVENNLDKFFIVANFFQLAENVKAALAKTTYVILEHDHKYVRSNNPSLYKDFLAPERQIQNKAFYKNALAVLCQSKKHAGVVQRNLLINNIVNLGGNIWNEEQLATLENNLHAEKAIKYGILQSNNRNKGMPAAIAYCQRNGIDFKLIEPKPFPEFIRDISQVETLVFFPQWLETYSRFAIESRILGCKLITNSLIGATSEDYFKLKGKELLDFIRQNNQNLRQRWIKLIDKSEIKYFPPLDLPKITVFCPLYAGQQYIEGFLKSMQEQTIFDQCELIIIDANSPENESQYIEEFMKEHENVIYKRLDYRASVMETENMAIHMATGEFFAQACVDDRHHREYLEIMSKHLHYHEDIDLVYTDCLQTKKPNETVETNSSAGDYYEHSRNEFSPENMIKCLPGPMPMWKLSVHEKCGYFDEGLSYAGDWDIFLSMVAAGSKFKKIDIPLGLYYFNSEGLSTSTENQIPRGKEEAEVFFKHKNVFGEANYNKYKNYFSQFIRNENESTT